MTESSDHLELARKKLRTGAQVPEIERALIARGLDAANASKIVDEAITSKLAAMIPTSARRPFSLWRVLLGIGVAVAAFIGIYVALASSTENVMMGVGALPGAARGLIVGAGGGIAVAALHMVKSELMRLAAD